jgi:PAS domain S-box-containing protein
MKPGKNLIISFVLILGFGIYFFISSYQNKKQAEILNNWVLHTHLVIEEITAFNTLITEFEAQDQAYVITNNKDFKKDINSRNGKAEGLLSKLKKLTADNKVQQDNLQHLSEVVEAKISYRNNVLKVLEKSQQRALLLMVDTESKRLYTEIKSRLKTMLNVENRLLEKRTARHEALLNEKFLYSIAFEFLGLILLVVALLRIHEERISKKIAEKEARKSETKFKALIEKSSLIIFTADLRGTFTYISAKGLELTGYDSEELLGKPFNILVPETGRKEVTRFYLNQYRHFTKDLVEEFEILTKDGDIKVIQLSAVLIENENNVVGFQSIARDITEIKYVESLVRESKIKLQQQQEEYHLRLHAVIDNIPMVLYIQDLEGNYITVNKNFTEIFGFRDEQIVGRKNCEIEAFRAKADYFEGIDLRVKNTCKPIEFEQVITTQQGDKTFLVTKFPLLDRENNIFAISSVAKDITDMTYHRQQLIDARMKAEKAEQLQESFLANMSHEIRTPMNGIMGMSNMLLDTNLDEEQKEYAELIKRSSDSLLILINDILDLSKIKAGRMELEAIDFNIEEAVENVLQPMKINLKKDVLLNYSISKSVPEFVKGDSHKLFQILNNLVSNAIKFTERGEVKIEINVIERNDEKIYLKLDVSDTGIGISDENIKNIFQNFTQAGNDTVRRFGGTGLGLAITKRLVELQSGSIEVESTLGAGSVFHVEIPYLPANVKTSVSSLSGNSDTAAESAAIENKRILIVEDNLVNQRVLTSVLQKLKVESNIANNGKEAIDILEKDIEYDLIIMDLQMPVMDGFQAATHIRKILKIDTPIIAMTASTLQNEKVKCLETGMNEYLAKPFSPNELIKRIHSLINPTTKKEKQMEREQMSKEKLYNLEYLLELDDNDYLIEMIELFFETTSQMLEEIRESVKEKNWDVVAGTAHKIKSSLGPLQITKMIAIASAMEENAKQKINLDELSYQSKELHNYYNIVKPLIEDELAKAKKVSNGFVAV